MPEAFDRCVASGGRVRYTDKHCPEGHHRKVCFLNGKSYPGHLEKKKPNPARAVG